MAALLRRGAFPNYAPPPTKLSPLMCAAAGGHLKAVALLISHGASATHRDTLGRTAWDIAGAAGQTEVQILLARVANGGAAGLITPNDKHPGQLHVERHITQGGVATIQHEAVLRRVLPPLAD